MSKLFKKYSSTTYEFEFKDKDGETFEFNFKNEPTKEFIELLMKEQGYIKYNSDKSTTKHAKLGFIDIGMSLNKSNENRIELK